MKSTPAIKNIRMYKNKIDGKPKRVTTGKEKLLHKVKAKIHTNGMAFNSLGDDKIRSRQALVRISKRIRKK